MPKYKRWTDDEMENALDFISSGGSIHKASRDFGIPRGTLQCRLKNGNLKQQGKQPLLTKYEESQIVKYAKFMSRTGHPVTPSWIRDTAARIMSCRYVYFYNINSINM